MDKRRAGTVRIDRRPHHIKQILSTIWPMVTAKAATNKIDLIEDLAEDLPDVFVDAEKVGRIIVNLAVNAIKFSREGGRVTISGRLGMDGGVEIGVTDQGPGIAPENLEIIFQRFKQVGNAQGSATKGFGLGLNIARELVALNLGEISVSSDVGHRSTFSFTLPPNDPTAILKRYLSYLKTLDANDSCIALLRATTDVEAPMRDELRGMLCSIVRPSELVLVGPGNESLLVLGCTGNADRWLQRLRQTTAEWHTQEPRQITAAPLRWEEVARWAYPVDTEQVMAQVLESLSMETVLV
jgi:hypothetical protein